MRPTSKLGLILFAAVAAGCASAPEPVRQGLAGTQWTLHAIQSMDDAQGTTRIADPARFTLRFEPDGKAGLRLDCNRGAATWKSAPADDGASGQLQFGPIAATRALCAPPRLDERVARDLAYVRSYLFKDGKLFLLLMADGGIYEWHAIPY